MFASIPSHLARRWPIFFGAAAAGLAALLVSSELALAQFTQQGPKLVGTLPVGSPEQGYSVALSADGDTAIVGGPSDNSQIGAAWVYTRRGGVWTQHGNKLVGTGSVGNAQQGWSVALSADGDTFDNNGSGAAWVFTRRRGVWTQQDDKLVGSDAVGTAQRNAEQGWSVALSADGNTAVAGGPFDNNGIGAAWVFIQPTKDDCKDGRWLNFVSRTSPFTFTNESQCASYFAQQK